MDMNNWPVVRYHPVFITGFIPGSSLWGFNLSLCAVNLAEAAGESISLTVLAEIYVSAALRVMSTRMKFAAVSICLEIDTEWF